MAGSAATISGTIYSALTSGLGVLVVDSDGSDEFASYIEQGISGTELDSTGDTPYIIGSIALHPAGGDAVMVSGVVYSALPCGSGILVVADGKSTTIGLASTTNGPRGSQTTATGGSTTGDSPEPYTGIATSRSGFLTGCNACMLIRLIVLVAML
jgi:hypothetical protein